MSEAKLLFKYTSRSRKSNFFRGLDSIYNNLANKEDFAVLCSFDVDDTAYRNFAFVDQLETYENLEHFFGISTSKINAINRDIKLAPQWDIIICMSDDMVFTQWGFDDMIRVEMQKHFPDYDGVLHFKDTNNNRALMTLSILGKKYFDRTGTIYEPCYTSLWCDLEAMQVAQKLGKYAYVKDVIFEHLHPAYKKAPTDEQYTKTESYYHTDGKIYYERLSKNFYI